MSTTPAARLRRLWIGAVVALGVLSIGALWAVALSGPEVCAWGGPTLCFAAPRAQLAGLITALVAVGVVVLAALGTRAKSKMRTCALAVCAAIVLVTAVSVAAMM